MDGGSGIVQFGLILVRAVGGSCIVQFGLILVRAVGGSCIFQFGLYLIRAIGAALFFCLSRRPTVHRSHFDIAQLGLLLTGCAASVRQKPVNKRPN